MNKSLPANFLWGNSVSSMQTEGAWNEGGKGMSVYDIREAEKTSPTGKLPRIPTTGTGKTST